MRRIVTAHGVHLVNGDPLYGFAAIDGRRIYADHSMFRSDQRCGTFRYWDID